MRSAVSLYLFLLITSLVSAQQLRWSDEFNGPAGSPPDAAKWTYDLGAGGWGNHELETYTKSPDNIHLDGNGHLVIRATKTSGGYQSARIKTQGLFSFTYRLVEARMKLPRGPGIWPAFWMLGDDIKSAGWPKCGEIDIMELIGREPLTVHGTIHGPGYSGAKGISTPFQLKPQANPSEHFHVYAVEWRKDEIRFLVDKKVYKQITPASLPPNTTWVYDHPMFLLLNLAVGGAWPGNPDATTKFPQDYVIDWVRVYQQ